MSSDADTIQQTQGANISALLVGAHSYGPDDLFTTVFELHNLLRPRLTKRTTPQLNAKSLANLPSEGANRARADSESSATTVCGDGADVAADDLTDVEEDLTDTEEVEDDENEKIIKQKPVVMRTPPYDRSDRLDCLLPLKLDGEALAWVSFLEKRASTLGKLKLRNPEDMVTPGSVIEAGTSTDDDMFASLQSLVKDIRTEIEVLKDLDRDAVARCLEVISCYYEKFPSKCISHGTTALEPSVLVSGIGVPNMRMWKDEADSLIDTAIKEGTLTLPNNNVITLKRFSVDPDEGRWPVLNSAVSALRKCLFDKAQRNSGYIIIGGIDQSIGVQVQPKVEDCVPLEEFVKNRGSSKLDPVELSQAIVLAVLSTTSGSSDTLVLPDGKLVQFGDRATFLMPFTQQDNGRHVVNLDHELFYSNEIMDAPVDQTVITAFRKSHNIVSVLEWLGTLVDDQHETDRLRKIGSLAKQTVHNSAWFIPGAIASISRTWQQIAAFIEQLSEGEFPTHRQLFHAAIPAAEQYFTQLDAPSDALLEDVQSDDGVPPISEHVCLPHSTTLRGTVEEAAHEILSSIDPRDLEPQLIAKIVHVLTTWFTSKFASQERLPAKWQSYKELIGAVLSSDSATIEDISFCATDEPGSNGGTPLHALVQTAVGRDPDVVVRLVGELLQAGVDVHAADSAGLTALCHAASLQLHPVFIRLVEAGAHGGQHTTALVQYRNALLQTAMTPELKLSHQALKRVAARNRKVAWYFSWSLLFPSTTTREECIFQTESFSSCKVQPIVRNQLFKTDGSFNTVNTFGRRLVGKIGIENKTYGHLFLKVRPELPGVESAVRELARLLFGVNAMPYVELVRWSKAVKGTKGLGPGTPVLVSQGVPGPTLQEVISEKDEAKKNEILKKLDPNSVSEALILALLTMPEDGKPDNYICEPNGDGKYRLIGIDNDHAFAPAVAMEKGHKELKVKCCLFCLDEMNSVISEKVRKDLLRVDAVNLVRDWLSRLKKRHVAHARLFREEDEVTRLLRDKKEPCALGVPFRNGAVKRLCDKIVRIQSLLNREPKCTHFDLMKEAEPMLAVRYRVALNKRDLDVGQRFRDVDGEFFSRVMAGNYESMFNSRQMLSLNLLGMKTDAGVLLKMLKGEQYGPVQALQELETFASQWNKAELSKFMSDQGLDSDLHKMPADQIEKMMETIDFQDIPTTTQQVLLNELRQKDLRHISFIRCMIVDDRMLDGLLQFRSVTKIHLNGCMQINLSFALLHAIAECCRALTHWSMSDLPQPRRVARATVTSVRALELPMLEFLSITRLPLLCEVRLEAPNLARVEIFECPKLSVLELSSPSLDRLDIIDCDNMQEQELSTFAQSCTNSSLAFINVGLFGLTPIMTKTIYGEAMIRSILMKGGDRFWGTAKRIASIADDEPPMESSILCGTSEEEIAWEAAKFVFKISGHNSDFAREVLTGEKPVVWDLVQHAARVSIAQNNAVLAKQIVKIGVQENWDIGLAVAEVAILDGNMGASLISAGEANGWDVVTAVASVAMKDLSLAETMLSIGTTHGWASAETLAKVAVDEPELVLPLLNLGIQRDWETVFHLAAIASYSKDVVEAILKLGETHDWDVAGKLAKCASNNPTTSRLDMINCRLGVTDVESIAHILRVNTNLEVVVLSGCTIDDLGGVKLARSLSGDLSSSNLSELQLWDCPCGEKTAAALGDTLISGSKLRAINLRGLAFSRAGVISFLSALKQPNQLSDLRINNCQLDSGAAKVLGEVLCSNATLQTLELANAELGDQGGNELAKGLSQNKSIVRFSLSRVAIGESSGLAIGQAVSKLKTLKSFDLYGDDITESGCNSILVGLQESRSIQNLRLWMCGLKDSSADLLGTLLKHNPTLKSLSISAEGLTTDGIVRIGSGILTKSGLQILRIGGNTALDTAIKDTLGDNSATLVMI